MYRKRKILRVFSSLILILFLGLLVPNIVRAEDAVGSYTITAWNNTINESTGNWIIRHNCTLDLSQIPNDSGQTYSDAGNKTIVVDGTGVAVIIKGSVSETYKNLAIVIKGGAAVTIENLNITNDVFVSSPIIAGDSNSNNDLKFLGTNNIIANIYNCPGIKVTEPYVITINGEDTSSKLQVIGGNEAAGIGGRFGESGGTITIGGSGTVTATGGGYGAGIGGGNSINDPEVIGGTITIGGSGTIIATGGGYGAGIGGGFYGKGGTITIGGSGTVTATGGECGAGIGGGFAGKGGTITIGGSGTVTATGGEAAAGIGGGCGGDGGTITIEGSGTVTAIGGRGGAGIGGGTYGRGETITIEGSGTVTATGIGSGAGIGGGFAGKGGTITIGGNGAVIATGGQYGAGIGGGADENGNLITTGSSVLIGGSGTVAVSGSGSTTVKLTGVAPTIIGAADGKITGTTTAMEYKLSSAEDSTYADCTGPETASLLPGSYSVRIKAAVSSAVTVSVPESHVPAAPTGLLGVAPTIIGATDGKITGTTTAMEYKLSSADDITYADCTGPETDSLLPGSYSVRIKAADGNAASSAVTVSVQESHVPAAPTGLLGVAPTTIGATDGKITGTTTDMEYKLSSADDSTYAGCTEPEIVNLLPGSYSVRVKADLGAGNTVSAAVTVTVPESNIPAAPANLTATAGVLKVGLSWNGASAATSYKVYKSTASGTGYQLVSDNINTTTIEANGLTAGTTYYFVVKASKDGVDSSNSNEVSAVPQADTEKPVIHLNGSSPVNLTYGETYIDQGATASDNIDGNITAGIVKIIISPSGTTISAINTSQPGTYTIHYNVSDAVGNIADEVTRTVIVQDYVPPYIPPEIPPTPQPIIENRQASIIVGKGEASAQVMVERITYPDGTKKDTIIFDENATEKIIKETLQENTTFADIYITDTSVNSPDITVIKFPKASLEKLGDNSIAIRLKTEKVSFYLTAETLTKLKGKDVEITISKEKDSSEIGNTKALILKLASGGQIISDTLKIEANYTGTTKITIPIDLATLPKEKEELNKFLNSLAVMVHHSDGEDVVDKGTIVYDEKGNVIGISIWVEKFSSFTLINMPAIYFQGKTTIMPDKVAADKEWSIKFSKPVDATTATKDNVYVVDSKGNKVEVKVSYSLDEVLKVTPVNPYTSGEAYYLYITKNVKAKDRTSLVNELRYQFTIK